MFFALVCSFLFSINIFGVTCGDFLPEPFHEKSIVVFKNPVPVEGLVVDRTLAELWTHWNMGFQRSFVFKESGELVDISALRGMRPKPLEIFPYLRSIRDFVRSVYFKEYGIYPVEVQMNIRATSNSKGFTIRPGRNGGDQDGLHNHLPRHPFEPKPLQVMDFVLALKGPGPVVLKGQRVEETKGNELVLMGIEVLHGSPQSIEDRLVVVGRAFSGQR